MSDIPKKDIFSSITLNALAEELIYGSFAGLAICVIGHPFE